MANNSQHSTLTDRDLYREINSRLRDIYNRIEYLDSSLIDDSNTNNNYIMIELANVNRQIAELEFKADIYGSILRQLEQIIIV